MSEELIRTLVIDDSTFSRRAITRMLEVSPLVRVVGTARDGEEALQKTFEMKPDLITLDLEMPRMDGFTFLRLVMAKQPTPVIVVSSRSGDQDIFKALDLGAVDFIAKPAQRPSLELEQIQQELLRKVHALRQLRIQKVRERITSLPRLMAGYAPSRLLQPPKVVAIGSSTGGPGALMQILGSFVEVPKTAILISQHMPAGFTKGFAERMGRMTPFRAVEAQGGEALEPGLILVAPGGYHMVLENVGGRTVTKIEDQTVQDRYAPSVDRMFISAAKHFGSELMAVVLTGMGDDGRQGVCAVSDAGGCVVAESEETAIIFGMPQQAIRAGVVDAVLPLHKIGSAIQTGIRRKDRRETVRRKDQQ